MVRGQILRFVLAFLWNICIEITFALLPHRLYILLYYHLQWWMTHGTDTSKQLWPAAKIIFHSNAQWIPLKIKANSSAAVTAYSLRAYQIISYYVSQNVFCFREARLPNIEILHNCHSAAAYTVCIQFLLECKFLNFTYINPFSASLQIADPFRVPFLLFSCYDVCRYRMLIALS
jgi:hypothetical protein